MKSPPSDNFYTDKLSSLYELIFFFCIIRKCKRYQLKFSMRSVFNKDRQFQCIMNLACKMQRSNSPWHFKFVARNREHKAHTNYDKTNVPVIVGTMCKSLRVHKSTYVPDYNLWSLPSEKLLKYTMHMLKKLSSREKKNMVHFHQKISFFISTFYIHVNK